MKLIATMATGAVLFGGVGQAYAQQAPQSPESLQADCNVIEGQLATSLGQAQRQVIQLKTQVADLQKQLDDAKKAPPPAPEKK